MSELKFQLIVRFLVSELMPYDRKSAKAQQNRQFLEDVGEERAFRVQPLAFLFDPISPHLRFPRNSNKAPFLNDLRPLKQSTQHRILKMTHLGSKGTEMTFLKPDEWK